MKDNRVTIEEFAGFLGYVMKQGIVWKMSLKINDTAEQWALDNGYTVVELFNVKS